MFEDIDLKVADANEAPSLTISTVTKIAHCTVTGCYGTSCKYPC